MLVIFCVLDTTVSIAKTDELIERWRLLGRLAWSEGTLH